MQIVSPTQLKQYFLLAIIIGLALLLGKHLYSTFPGLLGAVTFYILMREKFYRLTVMRGWKKWYTALLFILTALVIFVLPFIGLAMMIAPTISQFLSNSDQATKSLQGFTQKFGHAIPGLTFGEAQIHELTQKMTNSIPDLLGAAGGAFTNLLICFFILYFLLVDGRKIERTLQSYMPLKEENIDEVWQATRVMVISNAIGIPFLAVFQAITACIGYKIFGIDNWLLWGTLTGICSVLPVVGTAVVWVPMSIYLIGTGHSGAGIGLLVYAIAVIGSIDNVLRFTLLKKIGNVHPVITVLGIIIGIPLFGFIGLIFGPLLISYLLLLVKIYQVEFSSKHLQRSDGV